MHDVHKAIRSMLNLGPVGIPLHAIVAPFAVSLLFGAAVCDLFSAMGLWNHGGVVTWTSYYLILAGLCALIPLVPLAVFELLLLSSGRKLGALYLFLLANAAGCFAFTYFRRPYPKESNEETIATPLLLWSIVGGISILAASRVGSYLVYRHRLGVTPPRKLAPTLSAPRNRHPMHTLFSHLPMGVWMLSIVFDAMAMTDRWQQPWIIKAAFFSIAIGCIASLLAVITGVIDWLRTHEDHPAHAMILVHMFIAMAGTAIFIFNAGERWKQINYLVPKQNVVLLSQIGFGVIFIAGLLGARLVYRNNVSVTPAPPDEQG